MKYAGGSGDFNPLHYDYQFPQAKQIGSIIVHGRFKYAALGELVSNWLGHRGPHPAASPASTAAWTCPTRTSSAAAR